MLESKIQEQIVKFFALNKIFCHSIPNELAGGSSNAALRTMRFVATGLKKGVADLIVWWPDGVIGYLEVKTKTGRLSDNQKKFQKRCENHHIRYDVARSLDDVENLFKKYY